MDFLRTYIETMIDINDTEWQMVTKLFTKKEYKKGDELFSAGEICYKLHYISSGIVRIYSLSTDGKDFTIALNYNMDDFKIDVFSGDYVSYLTKSESMFFAEALEDCTVYEADFRDLDKLYESSLKWMTLARKISDFQLVTVIQRVQMMKRLTAKEKYLLIKEIAPIYEEVLPDYQFATLLGITPQGLSRIKGNL